MIELGLALVISILAYVFCGDGDDILSRCIRVVSVILAITSWVMLLIWRWMIG